MPETILITGATGTVGSEAVKALATTEARVRAGVHSLIKGDRFKIFPDVELVEMDFAQPESLKVAFTGVTRVFQITPFIPEQVAIGKQLVDAAKQAGVKQVVKLSASGADAEPGIQMGRWHREVEKYLETSGLSYTLLRPASFMQNFINYQGHSIRQEGKIYQPLGEGKAGYIDVRDIAAVAKVVLTEPGHAGKAYELTGPEAISVARVAATLSEATGRYIMYVNVPEDAARQAMSSMHMPDQMINGMMELNAIMKAGYAANVTDTVEKLTGQAPRTFAEFARDYASSFMPAQ